MLPVLLMLLVTSPAFAAAPKWEIVPEKSRITFKAKQMGAEFKGGFDRFTADIAFDPDDLAGSAVEVDVDTSSINTQAADRDENIKGKDWFDVGQFPVARFETTAFRKTGDKTYEATGRLTIRDITLPVVLPFSLEIKEQIATADGSVILDRSKFSLGGSAWTDPGVIANEVRVNIHVVASRDKAVP
jgi:polyisoprenoid-binding protein YceI